MSEQTLGMLTDVRRRTRDASASAVQRGRTDPEFESALPAVAEGITRELLLAEIATGVLDSYAKQAAVLLMVNEELESLGLVGDTPASCPDTLVTGG